MLQLALQQPVTQWVLKNIFLHLRYGSYKNTKKNIGLQKDWCFKRRQTSQKFLSRGHKKDQLELAKGAGRSFSSCVTDGLSCCTVVLHESGQLHFRFSKPSVIWSPLLHSCPLISDNIACFFPKKTRAFRKKLPQHRILSICHLHTSLQLQPFFLLPSQTFLFSYFSSSSYALMPLHTQFPLKQKPLFHCVCSFSSHSSIKHHPFLGALPDILKQSRTCLLCALKPLCVFLY